MPQIPNVTNVGNDLSAVGGVTTGIGSLVEEQGKAAGARAAAQGYATEAQLYGEASQIAGQNLAIEQGSVALQQYMNTRALRQTQASVRAATAASGLGLSGSEQYILRQNAMLGGISAAVIGQQGAIQENAYRVQQTTLQGEAAQATATSKQALATANAAQTGGFLGLLGGVAKGASFLFA